MARGGCIGKFEQAVSGTLDTSKRSRVKSRVCKTARDAVFSHKNKVTYRNYSCDIAKVDKKRRIVKLDTCGHHSNTTKDRLNGVLDSLRTGKKIVQRKGDWKINGSDFNDGDVVKY